jgi:hypothetical protein
MRSGASDVTISIVQEGCQERQDVRLAVSARQFASPRAMPWKRIAEKVSEEHTPIFTVRLLPQGRGSLPPNRDFGVILVYFENDLKVCVIPNHGQSS